MTSHAMARALGLDFGTTNTVAALADGHGGSQLVEYARADATGAVYCEGKSINVGSRIGTAEGRITDAAGRLYAHGTTTCLIFPL